MFACGKSRPRLLSKYTGAPICAYFESVRHEGVTVKGKYLYSALFVVPHTQGAQAWITPAITCNYTNTCLNLVSVHQMAPPQTEVADN